MNIAVLNDDFPPYHEGGTGIIAAQLARAFARAGHSVLVITTVRRREDAGEVHEAGVRIVRLYAGYDPRFRAYVSLYNPRLVREVGRLLREFSPDIAHVHNVHFYLSYCAIVAARKYARKVYMTAHDAMSFQYGKLPSVAEDARAGFMGTDVYRESAWRQFKMHRWQYNPLRTALVRRIIRNNVDTVVAVSEALARALRGNGFPRAVVIRNGIDAAAWERPDGVESFAHERGIGRRAILFGGRLSEMKGALAMIAALAAMHKTVPDAQLLVVGKKDAQAEKMLAYARSLGVVGQLVFTGWVRVPDLCRAYYASSIVAVPSLYLDPFPTMNLEALACGKPVVATCFGGSAEIVQDGVNGYIVDPLHTEALAARLSELLLDTHKNAAFGTSGRAHVIADFSLAGQVAAYGRLFGIAGP